MSKYTQHRSDENIILSFTPFYLLTPNFKEITMSKRNFRSRMKIGFVLVFLSVIWVGPVAFAEEESCRYCGMKKSEYGHSWVIVDHGENKVEGFCSVHCAAIDMALHTDKPVLKITVGDYDSKEQVDAEKAYWVIGGDKMGVMTSRAKWAFQSKDSADEFIKTHGGRPATFQEVMKAAFEDMYEDTMMIRKKREMMRMNKANPGN